MKGHWFRWRGLAVRQDGAGVNRPKQITFVVMLSKIVFVMFACEAAVMMMLNRLRLLDATSIILDPILLSLLGAPLLYWVIARPLRHGIAALEEAQEDLRRRSGELQAAKAELERINREITAANLEFRESWQQTVEREKTMSITTIAAGIAHEVGNPLASLSSIVQLQKRHNESPEEKEKLMVMEELIARISRIIRQLVEFAAPKPGNWRLADLDILVEETLAIVKYSLRARHVRIDSVRNRNLPKVPIVVQQLQEVLINVLLNAIDAIDEMGGERIIRVERAVEGAYAIIMVKDTGAGMTQDQLQHAFEPFYTTKEPGKGTGLGLAVSRRLVEGQGGHIHIESAPGQGTLVTLSFQTAST
jgi:signal transduction histidine kinase